MNPFNRKRIKHPDTPQLFYYTHGDVFNPGAENLAFETTLLHPLQGIGGVVCGQLRVTQPPQVFQSLALPMQPLLGGTPVSSMILQPPIEDPNAPLQ